MRPLKVYLGQGRRVDTNVPYLVSWQIFHIHNPRAVFDPIPIFIQAPFFNPSLSKIILPEYWCPLGDLDLSTPLGLYWIDFVFHVTFLIAFIHLSANKSEIS